VATKPVPDYVAGNIDLEKGALELVTEFDIPTLRQDFSLTG